MQTNSTVIVSISLVTLIITNYELRGFQISYERLFFVSGEEKLLM